VKVHPDDAGILFMKAFRLPIAYPSVLAIRAVGRLKRPAKTDIMGNVLKLLGHWPLDGGKQ